MRPLTTTLSGIGLAALMAITPAAITPAMAQNPQADYAACDAWARQSVEPYLNQANAQGIGSALVGAGLGAALGGAIGGGRGAGIGAASGAIAGTGVGASNSAYASAQIQDMYNSYFYSCMQSRGSAGYRAPAYAPQPVYQQPAYQQPYPSYGYGYRPY
jgi:hypothetical protein